MLDFTTTLGADIAEENLTLLVVPLNLKVFVVSWDTNKAHWLSVLSKFNCWFEELAGSLLTIIPDLLQPGINLLRPQWTVKAFGNFIIHNIHKQFALGGVESRSVCKDGIWAWNLELLQFLSKDISHFVFRQCLTVTRTHFLDWLPTCWLELRDKISN